MSLDTGYTIAQMIITTSIFWLGFGLGTRQAAIKKREKSYTGATAKQLGIDHFVTVVEHRLRDAPVGAYADSIIAYGLVQYVFKNALEKAIGASPIEVNVFWNQYGHLNVKFMKVRERQP